MSGKYILNEYGEPVPELDIEKWSKWYKTTNRVIKSENIGNAQVSTTFLAFNHNLLVGGEDVIWETKVFGGKLDSEDERCSGNRQQAEVMHQRMVERVKATL